MKGALIGCGFVSQHHLAALSGVAGARLGALCDLDPDRLAQAARRFVLGPRERRVGAGQEWLRLADPAQGEQPVPEVFVGEPRRRVLRERVIPECHGVVVDLAPCPREGPEEHEDGESSRRREQRPQGHPRPVNCYGWTMDHELERYSIGPGLEWALVKVRNLRCASHR